MACRGIFGDQNCGQFCERLLFTTHMASKVRGLLRKAEISGCVLLLEGNFRACHCVFSGCRSGENEARSMRK